MTISPMASSVTMERGLATGSCCGSISIAVKSNAGSPADSIEVLDNSTRVTWPCGPTSSTS